MIFFPINKFTADLRSKLGLSRTASGDIEQIFLSVRLSFT